MTGALVKSEPGSTDTGKRGMDARARFVEKTWITEGRPLLTETEALVTLLTSAPSVKRKQWRKELAGLREITVPTSDKTLIAVCGSTGSGKSSLINAVLDGHILPTSSLQGMAFIWFRLSAKLCSDVPFSMYICGTGSQLSPVRDIRGEGGRTEILKSLNNEAGAAWAKVKAIYPDIVEMTDKLAVITEDDILALESDAKDYFDTVRHIESHNPTEFQDKLRKFVATDPSVGGVWPLVRQVRIKCNAKALSTGAVLVDLPGDGDANVARNNVSRAYLETSGHFWIVTPITRAVDDSKARGRTFSYYSGPLLIANICRVAYQIAPVAAGIFENEGETPVTLIASKSDDMEIMSVVKALQLSDDPKFQGLKETLDDYLQKIQHHSDEEARATKLADECEVELEGIPEDESPESPLGSKRKRLQEDESTHHRTARVAKRNATRFQQLADQYRQHIFSYCARHRSKFVTETLQREFIQDMKELGRNISVEDLPVFTCSSKEYSKITKKIDSDGVPNRFYSIDDTHIPQLQQYCHELTAQNRLHAVTHSMSRLLAVIQKIHHSEESLSRARENGRGAMLELWKTRKPRSNGMSCYEKENLDEVSELTDEGDSKYEDNPHGITPQLRERLEVALQSCIIAMRGHFKTCLKEAGETAAVAASREAVAKLNEEIRPLKWSTLNSLIRRDGEFRGINLNELFIKPYRTHMMNAWDATFQVDLFANFTSETMTIITQLAQEIEESALTEPMKLSVKKQGERAIEEARETLGKLISVAGTMVMDGRKQASRLLMPHIQTKLIAAYSQAQVIIGQGSLKKRQDALLSYVEDHEHSLFHGAEMVLLDKLHEVSGTIGEHLRSGFVELAEQFEATMVSIWKTPKGKAKEKNVYEDEIILRKINNLLKRANDVHDVVESMLDESTS